MSKENTNDTNTAQTAPPVPTEVPTVTTVPVDMEALKEQLRAEIKAEEAQEKASAERNAEMAHRKAMEDAKKDLVTIELFRDATTYVDDVRVIVNGVVYTIKRGVRVQVPRFVAEVIETSARQDNETVNLITAKENEYNSLKDQKIL